jgi:dephospho-CoA kinase
MREEATQNPRIIGLTGSFGSGCTYLADHILAAKGYKGVSLSDILRDVYSKEKGGSSEDIPRHELQAFGDEVRKKRGAGYLATEALREVEEVSKGGTCKWVIDSIRNPAEIRCLRECSRNFFLFGVYADKDVRWERVRKAYSDDRRLFEEDDKNDTGDDSEQHGQRVGDCFREADVVLTNNRHIGLSA